MEGEDAPAPFHTPLSIRPYLNSLCLPVVYLGEEVFVYIEEDNSLSVYVFRHSSHYPEVWYQGGLEYIYHVLLFNILFTSIIAFLMFPFLFRICTLLGCNPCILFCND